MLTGAGLIQVPRMSYLELRKSSLSLCLSLSPIFTNPLASHLFKPMASYVGLSPGQGTKMAHSMGQLSLCAATGEPMHRNEDTGQPNKQTNKKTQQQQKPTMASSARQDFSLLGPEYIHLPPQSLSPYPFQTNYS